MTDEEKSSIYIEFKDIGSVEIVGYQANSVTPLQLLAISAFLEFEGKSTLSVQRQAQLQAQMVREQKQKIAVPNSTIEIGK